MDSDRGRVGKGIAVKLTAFVLLALVCVTAVLSGCDHGHDHGHADDDGHGHSHGDNAQSFSGATHKEGTGIALIEETRHLLGIETVEVQEKALAREIQFTVRVFDTRAVEKHLASGIIPANDAALLQRESPVLFRSASGVCVTGVVQRVMQPLANGEAEVIVALNPEGSPLKQGDFGKVTVSVPGEGASLVVPAEAVIKGTGGSLVYVVNGDAYLLTWVELGKQADGWVEVTAGLLEGDSVVTRGVMDLWLVELRAVKGGQGCCPAPPKKGKG